MKVKKKIPETYHAIWYDGTQEHAEQLEKEGRGYCKYDEGGFIEFYIIDNNGCPHFTYEPCYIIWENGNIRKCNKETFWKYYEKV